jgi:hypothetical protein
VNGLLPCLGGLLGTALLGAVVFWTAYLIALGLAGSTRGSLRAVAAATTALWLLTVVHRALAALGLLRWPLALAVWLALAVTAHLGLARRLGAPARLRADLGRLRGALAESKAGGAGWALALSALLVAALALRALVAPPLGHDDLTYHLVKAARWVQTGGNASERFPDAWSYYEYFPDGGEVFWAWALLPAHDDSLLALWTFGTWALVALGAYAAARGLGARPAHALWGALALATAPAVLKYAPTAYVDNLGLGLLLFAAALLAAIAENPRPARISHTRSSRDAAKWSGSKATQETGSFPAPQQRACEKSGLGLALLTGAALGLAVSVKLTVLPLLLLAGVLLPLLLRGAPLRRQALAAGILVLGALPGAVPYARAWRETGSPTYPAQLRLFGHELFRGNDSWLWALANYTEPQHAQPALLRHALLPGERHDGFGVVSPLLFIAALPGMRRALAERRRRPVAYFLAGAAVLSLAVLASPAARALRSVWAADSVRFICPVLAAACVLAALVAARAFVWIAAAAVAGNLWLDLPLGWSREELPVLLRLAALAGAAILCAVAAVRSRRPARARLAWAGALALAAAALLYAYAARRAMRYVVYSAAADWRAFEVHVLGYSENWPVWRALDDGARHRVAMTVDCQRVGDNWLRYPLFGSQLQNRVLYVPPTAGGGVPDYCPGAARHLRFDFESWAARLAAANVDAVALLAPPTPEARWIAAHPERFRPIGCNGRLAPCAYQVVAASTPRDRVIPSR